MTASSTAQLLAQAAVTTTPAATSENLAQPLNAVESLAANAGLMTQQTFAVLLVMSIAVVTIVSLLLIYRNVRRASTWSLSEALSEEVPVGPITKTAAGEPIQDNDGNVQHENVMKASSSRLIALLGAIAIMMLYIGAGLAVLMEFASKGTIPAATKDFTTFFLYGMVLFAPYIVNKFSSIFSWLR